MSNLDETFADLHKALAEDLLARIRSGQATAAELNVARQMLKDNGIEAARRARVSTVEDLASYTVEDDVDALVKPITGATLNAMKERASLYEGNIEVTKVPGVGFTLSAMFPHLKAVAGE